MRFSSVSAALVLIALAAAASAHSVLKIPSPWAVAPSKSSPCGNGLRTATPAAKFTAGSNVTITWQVIAGDGNGPVSVSFDSAGGQTFPTSGANVAVVYGAAPSAVATYAIKIHIPSSLVCAACSMQVKSSTSWFSCSTVEVVAPAPGPAPAPTPAPAPPPASSAACSNAGNLTFCSQIKFKNIVSNSTALAAATELAVRATFNEISATGSSVFTTQTPQCLAVYSQYLCRNALPFCGEVVPCTSALCYGVVAACGLNESHAGLFPCATLAATQMATCAAQPNAAPTWRAAVSRAAATVFVLASSWAVHALVY